MTNGLSAFSRSMKLTERSVASAKPTTAKSKKGAPCNMLYMDEQQDGFGLRVSANGVKSYFVYRRVNGKQVSYTFRKVDEVPLAQARREAEQHYADMGRGINPIEEQRKKREAERAAEARSTTLQQALDSYERALKKRGAAARTIEDYRYLVEKYLAGWLNRELATITRKDIRQRHDDIPLEIARGKYTDGKRRGAEAGKLTANHVMRAFRAVFNYGWDEETQGPTPKLFDKKFVWFPEQRRTSRIPADGLKDWYDSVNASPNSVRRDYLLLTLFSGLRKENAAEPKLEHIDWQQRVLHVPKPKSQRPFDLPLSDYLVDLLKTRIEENKKLAPESQWVFPAARGEGHIVEVRLEGGEARAKGKVNGKRYTPHDLRRTFISVAESLGISREARQLLVNHSTPKADVHGGYVIPELEELRAHMQKITDRLLALCKPAAGGKVVPMRKKGAKGTR